MATAVTSATRVKPTFCTAKVEGKRPSCPFPPVESADSSLCARHLLIAANDVKQITPDVLVQIVRKEGA